MLRQVNPMPRKPTKAKPITARSARLRAIGFVRVSTGQQVADGTSLESQTTAVAARIAYEGWDHLETVVEAGVSGGRDSVRVEFERVMRMVRAGEVDAVVITRLDRLGRSTRQLQAAIGELDDHGVRLLSIAETFDSSTASGRLMRDVLAAVAEFEREAIRERMVTGQIAVARAGFWPGGTAPFGWRVVRGDKHAHLEVDDVEAATLLRAIALVLDEGHTAYAAVKILNAEGLLQRQGGRWTHNGLRRTLRAADGLSGVWIYESSAGDIAVPIPPLATLERHAQLERWLAETAVFHPRRTAGPAYMLTSRITCVCGRPMHGVTRKGRPTVYRCADNRTESVVACRATNVDADMIETTIWRQVTELLTDPARLAEFAGLAAATSVEAEASASESAASIATKIARIEKAIGERLANLYAQGKSDAIVAAATAALESDLERLTVQHRQVVSWERTARTTRDQAGRLATLAVNARRTLDNPNPEVRRRVIELLDIRVVVTGHIPCDTCAGKGVVLDLDAPQRGAWNGRGQPATCPSCRRLRSTPAISITGVVPAASSLGDTAADPGIASWRIVS